MSACDVRPARATVDHAGLVRGDRVLALVALAGDRHQVGLRVEGRRRSGRSLITASRCGLVVAGLRPQRAPSAHVVLDPRRKPCPGRRGRSRRPGCRSSCSDRPGCGACTRRRRQRRVLPGRARDAVVGQVVLAQELAPTAITRVGVPRPKAERRRDGLRARLDLVAAGRRRCPATARSAGTRDCCAIQRAGSPEGSGWLTSTVTRR